MSNNFTIKLNFPWLIISSFILVFSSFSATSVEDILHFQSQQEEQDYKELIAELRCPRCQNQNIADSNALVAKDMRYKTKQMLSEGASKQEVIDYMVGRYGDFVHYKPPIKASTIILWLVPLIFVAFALYRMKAQSVSLTTQNSAQSNKHWKEEDEADLEAKLAQVEQPEEKTK